MIDARRMVLVVLTVVLAAGAAAQAAQPTPGEIDALIRELGASSYAVRQRASDRLWRIGQPAVAALEKALQSGDPEVHARAGTILGDIQAGISPDWPPEVITLARSFDGYSTTQRRAAIEKVCKTFKGHALGFLLGRLAVGNSRDAAYALEKIKAIAAEDKSVYGQIIARIKQPRNAYEGQALVLAKVYRGETIAALKLMVQHKIGSGERGRIVTAAVADLLKLLGQFKFADAAGKASQFAEAVPADARFAYLHAEALAALGDERAEKLRAKALALNPTSEASHYTVGEMLQQKLGRRRLAELEWKKILSIDPANGVYDMNALLRLHTIYAACGRYGEAADRLSEALEMIEAARARRGSGVGIVGGTPEGLRKRIADLRARAKSGGAKADIKDANPDRQIDIHIGVTVKDGKLAELRQALGTAAATVTMNVQPRGLRLFDKGLLSVRYDAEKRQLGVYLHNKSLCGKPTPLTLSGKTARIAIASLDCHYIFEIDATGGPAKKLARFEKDYTLRFRPGNKIAACSDIAVKINDKPYKWKDLLAGVPFDYLPEKLNVALEGTQPSGKKLSMKFTATPTEPKIESLPAGISPPVNLPADRQVHPGR